MEKKLPFKANSSAPGIRRFSLATILCCSFLISSICSQAQLELLKDINTATESGFIGYSSLLPATSQVFFVRGSELWTTQGSTTNTTLVKKFNRVGPLTVSGNSVYFVADDGSGSGYELWKSNGTESGTVLIKDIYPGSASSEPAEITVVSSSAIYFSAYTPTHGREVWKTNGTTAGTQMVKDIMRVKGSSNPTELTKVNNTLFFVANDGQRGYELWKTDGTDAGTVLVRDIQTLAKGSSSPSHLTEMNGLLFFRAKDMVYDNELFKSDGTEAGTVVVKDIRPGAGNAEIENLINVNGTLFFTAHDGVHGDELWKSDGTEAGTMLVKDLNPGGAGSNSSSMWREPMSSFTNVNGVLFYSAARGYQSFFVRSDGTEAGTYRFADAGAMGLNELQPRFTYLDGHVYFFNMIYSESNSDDVYGLFRTDLNGQNVTMIRQYDKREDYYENFEQRMVAWNGNLYATNLYGSSWRILKISTDGSHSVLNNAEGPNVGSYPRGFVQANNRMFFIVENEWPGEGTFLYSTDGTEEGTIEITSISDGYELKAAGGTMFFSEGNSLYTTEGTNYQRLIMFDAPYRRIAGLTDVNGTLYFHNGLELWKSDGTVAGTVRVRVLNQIHSITNVGGKAFILNQTASGGMEVWRTNATGLLRVKVIREAPATNNAYKLTAGVGSVFFFVANDGVHGNELWRSDGTAVGTFMMADLNTYDSTVYNGEADLRSFAVFNNKLYFSAADAENNWKYYYVSGRTTIAEVGALGAVSHSIVHNGKLYLFAQRGVGDSFLKLWVTNGISGNLDYMADIGYGRIDDAVVNGNLYFVKEAGQIMQVTDCGITQINTGAAYSYEVEGFGDDLITSNYGSGVGVEPHIYRNIGDISSTCEAETARFASTAELKPVITPWPNPYVNDFTIRVHGEKGKYADVAVYSSSGFPIETFRALEANTDYEHIGFAWPKGMYIVKINYNGVLSTQTVVKK